MANAPKGNTRSRVVGSGHTLLYLDNKRLARLDSFVDRGVSPITAPYPVMSLDDRYPSEIVTSRVVGAGTLEISIREAWNEPVWAQLLNLIGGKETDVHNLPDLQDAFDRHFGTKELMVQMVIDPEVNATVALGTGDTQKSTALGVPRGKTYHNCVITDMSDTESVTLGDLTIAKTITLMYTHYKYFQGTRSKV